MNMTTKPTGFGTSKFKDSSELTSWIDKPLVQGKEEKQVYGVFKGGGPKGVAFAGAIKKCEEEGLRWKEVAGTSAGAITAALLAAGYDGDSYQKAINEIPFLGLMDPFNLDIVKKDAQKWENQIDVDGITKVIKLIDEGFFTTQKDNLHQELAQYFNKKREQEAQRLREEEQRIQQQETQRLQEEEERLALERHKNKRFYSRWFSNAQWAASGAFNGLYNGASFVYEKSPNITSRLYSGGNLIYSGGSKLASVIRHPFDSVTTGISSGVSYIAKSNFAINKTSSFIANKLGQQELGDIIGNTLNALANSDKEKAKEAIVGFLSSKYASKMPPAMLEVMKKPNGEDIDIDIALAVFLAIYYKGGAFKGENFIELMETYLQKTIRGDANIDLSRPVTFRELAIPAKLIASDVSNGRLLVFPEDLAMYGYDGQDGRMHYLDFPVAKAVRASMSLPLVFEPMYLPYESDKDGLAPTKWATLVDGGMLSNFPVEQFVSRKDEIDIYAFWLGDLELIEPFMTDRVSGYLGGCFTALQESHDRFILDHAGNNLHVCEIALKIPSTTQEQVELRKERDKITQQLQTDLDAANAELGKLTTDKEDADEAQDKITASKIQREINWIKNDIKALRAKLTKADEDYPIANRLCGTYDFTLEKEQKDALVENGYIAAGALFPS